MGYLRKIAEVFAVELRQQVADAPQHFVMRAIEVPRNVQAGGGGFAVNDG